MADFYAQLVIPQSTER